MYPPRLPVQKGDSIASEGKGEYMFVEGSVLNTSGVPIPAATIDTWETDSNGLYDTQVCPLLMGAITVIHRFTVFDAGGTRL